MLPDGTLFDWQNSVMGEIQILLLKGSNARRSMGNRAG